jgi:hypothetical protein
LDAFAYTRGAWTLVYADRASDSEDFADLISQLIPEAPSSAGMIPATSGRDILSGTKANPTVRGFEPFGALAETTLYA